MKREELENMGLSGEQVDSIMRVYDAENETAKQSHESEMNQLKVDFAVEKALTGAKAKNVKAVKALLDLDGVNLDKDGNVKGLAEQIENLKTDDGSSFMFSTPQPPTFRGFQPGLSGGIPDVVASEDATLRQAMKI